MTTNDSLKIHAKRLSNAFKDDRGTWSGRLEFVLSCVGFSVGIANVWRFPYVAYENGGGTFQLPYVILLVLVGIPLYLMEISRGQFARKGPVAVWTSCPVAVGIGWGMLVLCIIGVVYYAVLLAYTVLYMVSAFSATLPWEQCSEWWGADEHCYVRTAAHLQNCSSDDVNDTTTNNCTQIKTSSQQTAAQQFWEKYILNLSGSSGIDDLGGVQWRLALSLAFTWLCVYVCVFNGIKSVGKAVYFTATFPYVILLALLIQGVMLDGAMDGIQFFFTPNWNKLVDVNVWMNAARQMSYSLGLGNGVLITLASYNKFHNKCHVDAMCVSSLDFLTSLLASIVIFSVLGSLAKDLGIPITGVFQGGQGLAFIVFPEFATRLPLPQLWCFLFFFMLFMLGIDSTFSVFEATWAGIFDVYPHWRRHQPKLYFVSIVGFTILGLPFCTSGGQYLLNLVDNYNTMSRTLMVALEIIAVIWIYGLDRFCDDIEMMLNFRPNLYLKASWKVISPVLTLGLTIISWVKFSPPTYGDYHYPAWAHWIGWSIAILSLIQLPAWAIVELRKYWKQDNIWAAFKPTDQWVPAKDDVTDVSDTELETMLSDSNVKRRSQSNPL